METKSIFLSKTFWLNFITVALVILALPQFIAVIPPSYVPIIALISAVLNVAVRILSDSKPITLLGGYRPLR